MEENMSDAVRISALEAQEKIQSGSALLVCAYEDEANFKKYHLEGAISLADFRNRAGNLQNDQELIFYCN